MSINHYSLDLPEATTLWWTQQQQHHQQQQPMLMEMEPIPNPSISGPPSHPSWSPHHHHQPTWFSSHTPLHPPLEEDNNNSNNNNNDQTTTTTTTATSQPQGAEEEEKEHMFEKPLTPSDVGKLNRLVIPKQHAERYFPLGASGNNDSGECKGLLLSFEDESGKCWRFRYSYWNSSQSYVLTKGWSRYVKDKRLDAGDVVLFERHRADAQRMFINWRRRQNSGGAAPAHHVSRAGYGKSSGDGNEVSGGVGVGVGWTRGLYHAHPYPTHQHLPYHCLHAGSGSQNQRARPVGNNSSSPNSSSSSRVLRLFGVNMECQPEDEPSGPSTPECSYNMPSTQGLDTLHFYHHLQPSHTSNNPHPHLVRQQQYYY
ncbi:hypothetical protein RIF29_20733 [Crotalaria pallida]|uniref:TF-B3 domain-containing protein n=1 Tax=Crotalaria pallida TaxID=3830 RepID=A0AAN9F1R5_CROPI